MKYIWLILILFIIVKSVRQLLNRSTPRDKHVGPREESSSGREDLFLNSSPVGEPGRNEPKLNTLEDPTRGSGDPTAISTNITTCREHHDPHGGAEPFDGIVCPGEFIKGFIWSQILGPRGGLQAKK